MKKEDVALSLKKFRDAQLTGKEVYFDVNEVEDMLDYLEENEEFDYYEDILELGLRQHPNSTDLFCKQCDWFTSNGEYEKALQMIEETGYFRDFDIELTRLECYCALNQYDKVVDHIQKRMQDKTEDLEELFERLVPMIKDIETEGNQVMEFLQWGLRLFPDNLILKDELCFHLESIGDIKGAIQVCNELLDSNPYCREYWHTLGELHSYVQDYKKAIEAFDFALTCRETDTISDTELYITKAYCFYKNGDYEKAIEVYYDILKENEDLADRIVPFLTKCFIELDKYQDAYDILNMHLQDSESDVTPDVDIYINLILCCLRLNKNDELDKLFDLALEYYPKNTTLLNLLISKHQQEGNSEEAKKIQDQLFKMENKIGDGYLGKINQKQLKQFRTDKLTEKLMNEVSQNLKDIKIENTTSVDRLYFAAAFLVLGELDRFKEFICSVSEFEYNLFMKFLLKNSIFNDESFFKVDKIPEEYLPLQYLLKDVNIFPDSHTEDMEEDYIPAEDLTKDFLKSQKHKN